MKKLIIALFVITGLQSFCQTELPNMVLKNMEGLDVNIQEISKNDQVVIVSLWATWCVPCKKEFDAINDVYEQWQSETNVILYAVSIDDSRTVKRVRPMVTGRGWDYEILFDTNNELKRALGASTVPLTLVVKNNKVLYRHSGYSPGAEDELYKNILENIN
ncbi:MAG: TlpA disulfide reductase family protein [Flavobacteriaceae bacterium]